MSYAPHVLEIATEDPAHAFRVDEKIATYAGDVAAPLPSTQTPLAGHVKHECSNRTDTLPTVAAAAASNATRLMGALNVTFCAMTLELVTVAPASAAMPMPFSNIVF